MSTTEWQQSNIQHFWGKIAPNEHLVQIYDDTISFLNSLEGFVGSGILAGESVIVIATDKNLQSLNKRLLQQGFNLNKLISDDQYLMLNAEELLENFMEGESPNEIRFTKLITGILSRAKKNGRKARAFGEMVAILSAKGNSKGTLELENLWNKFLEAESFSLFCAYPRFSMTTTGRQHICSAHTKIISGSGGPSTQVFYKTINAKDKTLKPASLPKL
jgi:hypothetical protein